MSGEIVFMHAFQGLSDEELQQAKDFYSTCYYNKLDELEAVQVARSAISSLIRERRQAAREADQEEVI